jgi:radical SAM protein with 4Fe4S-binding SPASM domain
MSSRKTRRKPFSATLQITEGCNLRCKMCYYWGDTGTYSKGNSKNKPIIMEIGLIEQIVKESGAKFYSLFGGEPLTHPEIEKIIKIIKASGARIDTPTNGTLLKKHAAMLVELGFDSVRISLDGPSEVNNIQRGKGSYEKAIEGLKALYEEKKRQNKQLPVIGLLYTITPINYLQTEKFFLEDSNMKYFHNITIQLENYITEEMGKEYESFLKSHFDIKSNRYWKGMVRSHYHFKEIDLVELSRQLDSAINYLEEKGIVVIREPPLSSIEDLEAYFKAEWENLSIQYETCPLAWIATDIAANGDVVPCHVFYDLVVGNLHQNSLLEIWKGEKFEKFREYMDNNKLMSICQGCCLLYIHGTKINNKK